MNNNNNNYFLSGSDSDISSLLQSCSYNVESAINKYFDSGFSTINKKKEGKSIEKKEVIDNDDIIYVDDDEDEDINVHTDINGSYNIEDIKCSHGNGSDCKQCEIKSKTNNVKNYSSTTNNNHQTIETNNQISKKPKKLEEGNKLMIENIPNMFFLGQRIIVGICTSRNASCRAGESLEV